MAQANLWGGISRGISLGAQLGLQGMEQARADAREERMAQLQERQGILQQFQTLSQIGKAPRPLRKPLFQAWTQQYQALTGSQPNPDTVKAFESALSDDDTWSGMMGTIGEVLSGNVDQVNMKTFAPLFEEDPLKAMEFFLKLDERAQYQRELKRDEGGYGQLPMQEAQPPQQTPPPLAQGQMYGPTRYRAAIEQAAQQYGLDPSLLQAVMQVESAGNPRAVSPKGAQGLMQIMPATGQELGLQEPFDPGQNIDAGARYLAQQVQQFGDVPTALAAYNAGPGRVSSGQIPGETQGYVRRVMGLAQRYAGPGTVEAGTTEQGEAKAQIGRLDASIKRWMRVPGPEAKARVNDLQQERASVVGRLKDVETRDLQRQKFGFEQQESILSPEGFTRRLQLAEAEGRAKADVALETLRYTPAQQDKLTQLTNGLSLIDELKETPPEALERWVGYLNNPKERIKALFAADDEFQAFQAATARLTNSELFSRQEGGGGTLTDTERNALLKAIPTGQETGGVPQFKAKLDLMERTLERKLTSIENLAKAKPGEAAAILRKQRQEEAQARRDLSALRKFGQSQGSDKSIDELTPDELRQLK